jgi:hypothetical protein
MLFELLMRFSPLLLVVGFLLVYLRWGPEVKIVPARDSELSRRWLVNEVRSIDQKLGLARDCADMTDIGGFREAMISAMCSQLLVEKTVKLGWYAKLDGADRSAAIGMIEMYMRVHEMRDSLRFFGFYKINPRYTRSGWASSIQ